MPTCRSVIFVLHSPSANQRCALNREREVTRMETGVVTLSEKWDFGGGGDRGSEPPRTCHREVTELEGKHTSFTSGAAQRMPISTPACCETFTSVPVAPPPSKQSEKFLTIWLPWNLTAKYCAVTNEREVTTACHREARKRAFTQSVATWGHYDRPETVLRF